MFSSTEPVLAPILSECGCEPPSIEEESEALVICRRALREIERLAHRDCIRRLDDGIQLRAKDLTPKTQDEIGMLHVDSVPAMFDTLARIAISHAKDYPTRIKVAHASGAAVLNLIDGHRNDLKEEFKTEFPQYPDSTFHDVLRNAIREAVYAMEQECERAIEAQTSATTATQTQAARAINRGARLQAFLKAATKRLGIVTQIVA
jgi:hypothetical protein